ncbi:MAG: CPBP family intramembrane glutamic endopeptidase [Myxococcales bacterium]
MSRLRRTVRDPQGRLRGLLAALLFVLIGQSLVQILAALALELRPALAREGGWGFYVWVQLVQLAAFLLASLSLARWIDHEPLSRSGFRPVRGGARGFLLAVGLGALIPALAVAGAAVGGGASLAQGAPPRLLPTLALGLPGLSEEVFARGYLLYALSRSFLRLPGGVALTSAFFGALHALNPNFSALALATLILAGLFLASVRLYFDSLWAAMGAHAAFNLSEGVLLGQPVSGLRPEGAVLHLRLTGPDWLTGGDFGPEASLLALVALVVASAALLLGYARWRSSRPPDAQARTQ